MKDTVYDVTILGSGPGGLQAAIHASRKKAAVLMLGRIDNSSLYWAHVENYCCQLTISGEEILKTGREQAQQFGTQFRDEDVLSIEAKDTLFSIKLESGDTILSKTVIIATGSSRTKLKVPGEKEFLGKGVSYCVDCDAGFFKNEVVAVAGGRSAAVHGAVTLTNFASEVHLYCDALDVAEGLRQELDTSDVIVHEGVQIEAINGENAVQSIRLNDGATQNVSGVFIELGAKGVLELTAMLGVQLDDTMKYIKADKKQRTNIPGIYGAGDICGPPLQMAKAVGEGCVAGIEAANYAKKHLNTN
ncbi:thioredoxin reductase [Pseudodesulfovibrio sp. JC047]|uniref:NAD(P)/FAD-dependent oxidoreductase n=1 Tax=Pseudodesulfovibrio sp. JC047 TaxID=2683199 RepID=UPI0013D62FD4|nr:FAD-dependent oxidoreductase [Pseudodesulfovibrio sp. JC047]NDV20577.1 thioredoxin reductase [Pseudodesulfovibrio sp. JC047]